MTVVTTIRELPPTASTGPIRSTYDYQCRHMSVTAPVILVQVRCPASCEVGR